MSLAQTYLNRHILFEIAPGIVFLIVHHLLGLYWATGAVMFAAVVFCMLGIYIESRMPVFPIVTVLLVLVLGGATLLFNNELFIKMKPTVGNILFATLLMLGLLLRPSLLARALEGQVYLTEKGWKVLTIRWVLVALMLAGANEFVWRSMHTDTWVSFKAGLMPASIFLYITVTRLTAPAHWVNSENKI